MARAVETCVHCGFCLPACPTYRVLGEEMDSPRGRIVLMKEVLEGDLPLGDALPHIDRCLGCLACVTACPSGVQVRRVARAVPGAGRADGARSLLERLRRRFLLRTLESPALFRISARLGRVARPRRALLPTPLRTMLALLPDRLPRRGASAGNRRQPAARAARASRCWRAACSRCSTRTSTTRRCACWPRTASRWSCPRAQGCCGALALHAGDERRARASSVSAAPCVSRGCRCDRHQRRRVRLGDEGIRRRVPRERAGRRRGAASRRGCATSPSSSTTSVSCAPPRSARAVDRGLPRRMSSRARPGHPHSAAGAARAVPNLQRGGDSRRRDLLRVGRALQRRAPGDRRSDLGARKAQAIRSTGAQAVPPGNIGCLVQISHAPGALRAARCRCFTRCSCSIARTGRG